jgi:hypothetical protein
MLWYDRRDYYFAADVVFAITRDPYSRMLSEYHHQERGCNATHLNSYVHQKMKEYGDHKQILDCHLIPQSEYVFAPDGTQLVRCRGVRTSFAGHNLLFDIQFA